MSRRLPPVALLLALFSVLGWSRAAVAQPAIASDRPGFGTGAFVLEDGTTHLEAGAQLAIDGERQFSAGQIVVRWGLPFAELQALVNGCRPPMMRREAPLGVPTRSARASRTCASSPFQTRDPLFEDPSHVSGDLRVALAQRVPGRGG